MQKYMIFFRKANYYFSYISGTTNKNIRNITRSLD